MGGSKTVIPYPYVRLIVFIVLSGGLFAIAYSLAGIEQNAPRHEARWRAKVLVRALGQASLSSNGLDTEGAEHWIEGMKKRFSSSLPFARAFLIGETSGGMFAFLRKRIFLVHSQKGLKGQALKRESVEDKALYDLTNEIQNKTKKGKRHRFVLLQEIGKGRFIRAVMALYRGEKYLATAVVELPIAVSLEKAGGTARTELWALLFSWLFAVLLVALFFFFLRGPWGHLPAVIALAALAFYPYSRKVDRFLKAQDRVWQSRKVLVEGALLSSPRASVNWLQRVLPERSVRRFYFAPKKVDSLPSKLASQRRVRYLARALILRPFDVHLDHFPIKKWPYFWLGLGFILIYFMYAMGWLGRWGRIYYENRLAYAYIQPAMLAMLILVFIPFSVGVGLSFFRHLGGNKYVFVGLQNFINILSDPLHPFPHALNFYLTLLVTILWTVLNVSLHVAIGLGLALLLKNPLLRMKAVYRVLLILPWAVPNYITALIWKGMFHKQFGSVNALLSLFGIEPISWFSSFATAFTANLVTNTWLGFPFMMVISLGALQSIPSDLYEAADVDGASKWQKFRYITLPLLKPALFPAVILGAIWTFNMFNIIYLVSGGEPGGATDILITEAYRWAFQRGGRYGYAAAYSTIIFIILLVYSLVTNHLTKATEGVQ